MGKYKSESMDLQRIGMQNIFTESSVCVCVYHVYLI